MFAEMHGLYFAMFTQINGLNFGSVSRDKWALF
jgi:hypothetical protein